MDHYLRKLLTLGTLELDETLLSSIKKECKQSERQVEVAFQLTFFKYLNRNHAQIRYSCVQLIDILFKRSSRFRNLLIQHCSEFVQLTCGLIDHKPLPPPKTWALKTKQLALFCLKQWAEKYGHVHRELIIAMDLLKETEGICFDNLQFETSQEQLQREQRSRDIMKEKHQRAIQDFQEDQVHIEENLVKMTECFQMLVPDFTSTLQNRVISSSSQFKPQTFIDTIFENALGTSNYKLEIKFSSKDLQILETKDNNVIFDILREGYKVLVSKHIPLLTNWVDIASRTETSSISTSENVLKTWVDLKERAIEVKMKAEYFNIRMDGPVLIPTFDNEEEDDFDEVEFEEAFEDQANEIVELFGPDYSSDDYEKEFADNGHNNLLSKDNSTSNQDVIHSACRYPLKNGKLCQRKDMFKCPFHGKIIPRDDNGQPLIDLASTRQDGESSTKLQKIDQMQPWERIEHQINQLHGLQDPRNQQRNKRKSQLEKISKENKASRLMRKMKRLGRK